MTVNDFFVVRKGNRFLHINEETNIIKWTTKMKATWFKNRHAASHFSNLYQVINYEIENYVWYD